jgi:hypothetical protein
MPRKEELSIEERLERARELFNRKQQEKNKQISILYGSKIYKLAKKSCIVFLWVAQLIFIDWALPYSEIPDKITAGCQAHNERYNRRHSNKEVNLQVSTAQYKKVELLLFSGRLEPEIGDSVLILKSLLLRETKKLDDITNEQIYTVTNSLTYFLLPVIIMFSLLSILFLFIKNIEVKAFFYFIFFGNTACIIGLVSYFAAMQLQ